MNQDDEEPQPQIGPLPPDLSPDAIQYFYRQHGQALPPIMPRLFARARAQLVQPQLNANAMNLMLAPRQARLQPQLAIASKVKTLYGDLNLPSVSYIDAHYTLRAQSSDFIDGRYLFMAAATRRDFVVFDVLHRRYGL